MKNFELIEEGVVAEYEGGYWGLQYEDGYSSEYGFGSIFKATISDPKYCKKPTDMTYRGSRHLEKLEKASLRTVAKTTTYEVGYKT